MKGLKLFLLSLSLCISSFCYAEDNKLIVGIEGTCEPFVITDPNTLEHTGFDIDIIKKLAVKAGYDEIVLSDMPFDALLPSVLTEQVDIAISGITINEERKQIIDFIGPYFDAGLNALIKNKYKDTISKANGLAGKKVCTKAGTTCEAYTKTIPNVQIQAFDTEKESFSGLLSDKCEALVTDSPIIMNFLRQNPDAPYYALKDKLTFEQFGIMVSKNRPEIFERLQKAFDEFKDSEEFKEIYKKWFG